MQVDAELSETEPPRIPERFGLPGQLVISGAFNLDISHLAFSASSASRFEVVVSPSADYFIAEDVSLGGFAGFAYRWQASYLGDQLIKSRTTAFSFGLRAGYNLPLGRLFSLWPRAGFVFVTRDGVQRFPNGIGRSEGLTEEAPVYELAFNEVSIAVHLFAPLLLHPAPHFFLGIGPALDRDLLHETSSGNTEATFVSFGSTVGGWF